MDETFHRAWPADDDAGDRRQELESARLLARLLDDAVPIPGTSFRIGIDPLLGLFPVVGDLLGALLSSWLLVLARRLGAPPSVLARMGLTLAVDAVVGAIPFAGDLFDAGWKANRRNLILLERWLEQPARTSRASGWLVAGLIALVVAAAVGLTAGVWALLAWALGAR
ncbi:MAG: DUF4112 domain-containing protein [Anaeromyxobacter sp.]